MTKKLVLGFLIAMSAVGCATSGEVICEKIDECNLAEILFAGVSVSECAEQLDKNLTETQAEDCATCVDEASCSTITNGGCDAECSF